MTKSTGKRAAQKRREELFSAELKLGRVLLHLNDAVGWARMVGPLDSWDWVLDYVAAIGIVAERLAEVRREVAELG